MAIITSMRNSICARVRQVCNYVVWPVSAMLIKLGDI